MTELKSPNPKKHVAKKLSNGMDRANTLRMHTLSASSEPEVFDNSSKHVKKGWLLLICGDRNLMKINQSGSLTLKRIVFYLILSIDHPGDLVSASRKQKYLRQSG